MEDMKKGLGFGTFDPDGDMTVNMESVFGLESINERLHKIAEAERIRDYYKKNPEKKKAAQKKWYDSKGKEYHYNRYHQKLKLSFEPYPCHRCGELIECGIMNAADHFDKCEKNKVKI